NLYMSVCQMMTGSGGWPLNLILTPEKKPVFAFTYLPKHSRRNMMGIIELCQSVQELWKSRKDELIDRGKKVLEAIANPSASQEENPISTDLLKAAYTELQSAFDPQYGGFGSSPNFHRLITCSSL
ncbi:thymidylate kinase, partial [mine drainage metagenome]